MDITIPTTKEQKEFERRVQNLLSILSEMNADDVQKVIEFAIFISE